MNYFSKNKKWMAYLILLTFVFTCIMPTGMIFASGEISGEKNIWYGDELSVDVKAGTEGYTYMSLFRKYAHGYEFGGHFMGDGEGPQTFVVLDTVTHDKTIWEPNDLYKFGSSNYDVVYCCDVETMIVDGTYYKRLNLEDSEYYDDAQAAKIRAIVTNAYPYVSLEAMKASLAKEGFEYAEELTRNEIIAAVQCAIWVCANNMNADSLRYQKSYRVSDNLQWGYPLHDTSNESGLAVAGNRVFETYPEVGERINSLVDYLLAQNALYAEKNAIVISDLSIKEVIPVTEKDGVYKVVMQVTLNNSGSGYEDDIWLETVILDENGNVVELKTGEEPKKVKVEYGTETYNLVVEAKNGQTIKAIVFGKQVLPKGVYFYAPKPADIDKDDDIATSREVSQNLVGAAFGETSVYAEAKTPLEVNEPARAELALKKIDENGKFLTGAKFALYVKGDTGSIKVDTYDVDANGKLKIGGLLPGEYRLREAKAPAGYSRLKQAIEFIVNDDGEIKLNGDAPEGVAFDDENEFTIVNEPGGDIIVEKAVSGNIAPNEPFNFTLFLTEQKVSPFAEEMNAAGKKLNAMIDAMTIQATNGSVYTVDGTTLSQYVFTLDGKVSMASTSGSALGLELAPFAENSNLGDFLDEIKAELLKAYSSLKELLEGLCSNVIIKDTTVFMDQKELKDILEVRQLFDDAKAKDEKWQLENATASAMQITIGDTVCTTENGLQYDNENKWWELDFQVTPGEENAMNIHVEYTTGSVISYTIAEAVSDNSYYIGTDVSSGDGEDVNNGASIGKWVTLNDNGYYDSFVFRNRYGSIGGDGHEDSKKDETTPKPPETPEEIIDDPEVPLGDIEVPEEPVIEPEMEEELEDPEVPLGDAPATGDSANAVLFMALLAVAIGGLAITRRKFN